MAIATLETVIVPATPSASVHLGPWCPNILCTVRVVFIVDVCNKVIVVLAAETIQEQAEDSSRPANAAHCAGLVGAARATAAASVYSVNVKVSVEVALNLTSAWMELSRLTILLTLLLLGSRR